MTGPDTAPPDPDTAPPDPGGARPDLAAVLHPLTQALIDAELPVLAAHGMTMWGYVGLSALDGGPGEEGGFGGPRRAGRGAGAARGGARGAVGRGKAPHHQRARPPAGRRADLPPARPGRPAGAAPGDHRGRAGPAGGGAGRHP